MEHLPASTIAQIENAIELVIDECGHGEVVLIVAHGRLLDFVERRPVIRMLIRRDTGPPRMPTRTSGPTSG